MHHGKNADAFKEAFIPDCFSPSESEPLKGSVVNALVRRCRKRRGSDCFREKTSFIHHVNHSCCCDRRGGFPRAGPLPSLLHHIVKPSRLRRNPMNHVVRTRIWACRRKTGHLAASFRPRFPLCAQWRAGVGPTRFTSGAPPPLGCGPAPGMRSWALLWRLDSGEPLLYLSTAASNLIPSAGTQSYRRRESSSVCGILMREAGLGINFLKRQSS